MNQKGIAHIALMVLLLVGLVAGIYLVKQTQIFQPKAADLRPAFSVSAPANSSGVTCAGFENDCGACVDGNQTCKGQDRNGQACAISQSCDVEENENSCDCSGDQGTGVNYNKVSCDIAGVPSSNEKSCLGSFQEVDGRNDSCHYCVTPLDTPTPTPTQTSTDYPPYGYGPAQVVQGCDSGGWGNCSWGNQCPGERSECRDATIGPVNFPLYHYCCAPAMSAAECLKRFSPTWEWDSKTEKCQLKEGQLVGVGPECRNEVVAGNSFSGETEKVCLGKNTPGKFSQLGTDENCAFAGNDCNNEFPDSGGYCYKNPYPDQGGASYQCVSGTRPTDNSEPIVTNSCARKDCDSNLGKLVCIETLQNPDGTTSDRVGGATDEDCP